MFFLSSMINITWSLVFLFISVFGINMYKVSGHRFEQFRKEINRASIWKDDEPEGWIAGRWFFGYIYKSENGRGTINYELYLICTKQFYNIHISKTETICDDNDGNEKTENNGKNNYINFYSLEGNAYWNRHYCNRPLEITKLQPKHEQEEILKQLKAEYDSRSYVVALLHGPPNKGKSMVPYFLAKSLLLQTDSKIKKVSLVDTFNPFQPGDYFNTLYNKVSPSKDAPLIVVLEEINVCVFRMHEGSLKVHADIPTQITSKTDWNQFFDRFDRLQYPYVYFIMTTNETAGYFDNLDPSYMREGRVNLKCGIY
jgi:hypothetical protein